MAQPTDIYSLLAPEEAAEHRRLTRLISLAESPAPLTRAEIAELCGVTPERIRQIEKLALHKTKKAILTKYPDLIKEI